MSDLPPTPTAFAPSPFTDALAARLPELLAPAGDWECAHAAVENGADAIYFGLDKFNARMRAHNFTEADLPELMRFLHRRGVKGYVTFNTLVFPNELAEAEHYLRSIIAAGVDAAIVQDVGIARLIRRLSPDFPIHGSTQMTITSPAGVAFARELGCNLVVLARENSIAEIERIQAGQSEIGSKLQVEGCKTATANLQPATYNQQLPIEVFVHGALCVAYSGQCLTSESLGGRSANRGECAQACRMPYDLVSDGKLVDLGGRHYLLSPQDLAGLDVLPDLIRVGVASLKIEGRLKSPEYVASITRVYRQALDNFQFPISNLRPQAPAATPARPLVNRKSEIADSTDRYELEMAFSRGLFTGWFEGVDNQRLVHARFGKKRGVLLGDITGVKGQSLLVRLQAPLKPGDGVVIDTGVGDDHEQGGRIISLHPRGEITQVSFRPGQINPRRVKPGDKLWKTDDPELNKRVRATFAGDEIRFQRPLQYDFHGHNDAPLTVIGKDDEGHVAKAESRIPLMLAEKHPLTDESLAKQFGRLGGTPFKLGRLENRIEGALMLPLAELNRLRRVITDELERQRMEPKRWQLNTSEGRATRVPLVESQSGTRVARPSEVELILLVRNLEQLDAALRCGVETIYCEFEDPKKYREAVTKVRSHRPQASHSQGAAPCEDGTPLTRPAATLSPQPMRGEGRVRGASDCEADSPDSGAEAQPSQIANRKPRIWVAPPRIFKPGEEWILKLVRSCEADGYLVRNYDHLQFFADCRRRGDFSLNVANQLTADYFITRYGLERVTASYDLNVAQLESLLRAAPPEWFEITLHQHMPMFHMEHCVFCAFLSKGKDYRDCGRPCDKHDVRLRDRVGMEHPLKADAGCRNTVFNARAQTGAEFAAHLLALGARQFRVDFLNESPAEVEQTIGRYRQLLRGEITGQELWRELKLVNQLGVTRGQLDRAEGRQVVPKG
jgi:U32 family peptidase